MHESDSKCHPTLKIYGLYQKNKNNADSNKLSHNLNKNDFNLEVIKWSNLIMKNKDTKYDIRKELS